MTLKFFKETLKPIKAGNEMTFKAYFAAIAHNYANTKTEKMILDTNEMSEVVKVSKRMIKLN